MLPGGPAGVGRPWGGADAAPDQGRARKTPAGGRGPKGRPARRLLRGPRRVMSARRKCFLDPGSVGGGEVEASVNWYRLRLSAPGGCSPP